ncbi:hypothetical protein NDU88_004811 [Pleurodeles waltl]|uniref:Uncharacterized protein n=1 Tax=Pleurodeles waltl TaxID=8319 RepID=A0AAV7M864_PLEWA|nr:hypothetical protein NDU88_004811 [Pleurodeles waltl]
MPMLWAPDHCNWGLGSGAHGWSYSQIGICRGVPLDPGTTYSPKKAINLDAERGCGCPCIAVPAWCPWCRSPTADFIHMTWNCTTLCSYWQQVLDNLNRAARWAIPLETLQVLLGLIPSPSPRKLSRKFVILGLRLAKSCVAIKWLSPTRDITEWATVDEVHMKHVRIDDKLEDNLRPGRVSWQTSENPPQMILWNQQQVLHTPKMLNNYVIPLMYTLYLLRSKRNALRKSQNGCDEGFQFVGTILLVDYKIHMVHVQMIQSYCEFVNKTNKDHLKKKDMVPWH